MRRKAHRRQRRPPVAPGTQSECRPSYRIGPASRANSAVRVTIRDGPRRGGQHENRVIASSRRSACSSRAGLTNPLPPGITGDGAGRRLGLRQPTIADRDQRSTATRPAWRSRTITPSRPDDRSPGPSGPERSSPTGGSCRRAALAAGGRMPSCHWISSLTASGRRGEASPTAFAAYAAAPRACAPM